MPRRAPCVRRCERCARAACTVPSARPSSAARHASRADVRPGWVDGGARSDVVEGVGDHHRGGAVAGHQRERVKPGAPAGRTTGNWPAVCSWYRSPGLERSVRHRAMHRENASSQRSSRQEGGQQPGAGPRLRRCAAQPADSAAPPTASRLQAARRDAVHQRHRAREAQTASGRWPMLESPTRSPQILAAAQPPPLD